MRIKKNILKYKNPETGEYDPIPVVATDSVSKESIEAALGYTPADEGEVTELNEKIVQYVKSVNGFEPNEDGAVNIKYDATTEKGHRHSNLSKYQKTITVYQNDKYSNDAYVFLGKNYWPATENVDENIFDRHGLYLTTDKHNITIKGTATVTSMYILVNDDGSEYRDVQDGMNAGDVFRLYVFGNVSEYTSPFAKIEFFDENKTRISMIQVRVKAGDNFATGTTTIPNGVRFLRIMFSYNGGDTHDNTIFPVFVKNNVEVLTVQGFTNGVTSVISENETIELCTAPYESVVECQFDLKKYIDNKCSNVNFNMDEIEGMISFVSPEMFGAYGDDSHDDTSAMQACIDFAIEKNRKVVGGGKYLTKEPIRITGNGCSIDLHTIRYSGSEAAIIVNGSRNTIRITEILATNSVGFRLNSDIPSNYNNFYIGRVYSGSNCIEYITTSNNILFNNTVFGLLDSWSGFNCIYQSEEILGSNIYMNNNNFTGGKLSGGKWGVYGAKGADSYITCGFENVDNCVMMNGIGVCRLISPRYAEVKNTTDGSAGIVFAIDSSFGSNPIPFSNSRVAQVVIEAHGGSITVFNVDLRKGATEFVKEDGSFTPTGKGYPGACVVRCDLTTRGGSLLAKEFMTFGRHILIKEPVYYRTKSVTVSDIGYVGDYWETNTEDEFNIYGRFIIESSGCDYTLPPSYDVIAFNKFIVEQKEGASCTFRDWRGTIIFDGAQYGTGIYEVQVTIKNGVFHDFYDNRNQVWEIRRMSDCSLVDVMPHETV